MGTRWCREGGSNPHEVALGGCSVRFFNIAAACTVMHSEAETLSFVMVGATRPMHAAAKRCTEFRNKVSPLVSPKN
jgi:hypothetical protein